MKNKGSVRQIIAEFVGTSVFVAAIVGANSNPSTVLGGLAAPLAVGLMMVLLAGVSGGHFNPAVSLFFFARKDLRLGQFVGYVLAQLAGGLAGALLGGAIWNLSAPLTFNNSARTAGAAEIMSEVLGTAVLVWLTAKLVRDGKLALVAPVSAAWYFAAGLFTSTHAIANPAVAFGRFFTPVAGASLSASFGLELVVAQFAGTLLALLLFTFFVVTDPNKGKAKKAGKVKAKK